MSQEHCHTVCKGCIAIVPLGLHHPLMQNVFLLFVFFVALSDMRANGTEIPGYDSIGNANASLFPDATIVQWKMQQLWQMSVGSTHKCDVVLHGR
jgi:hypothetical protein